MCEAVVVLSIPCVIGLACSQREMKIILKNLSVSTALVFSIGRELSLDYPAIVKPNCLSSSSSSSVSISIIYIYIYIYILRGAVKYFFHSSLCHWTHYCFIILP